jgi:vancomycin resistance protein YoaR
MAFSQEPIEQLDAGGRSMRRLILAHLKEEGSSAALAGDNERAEAFLQQAISLDGKDPDLWALLGTVTADGELRGICARQALVLDPDHRQAQALLAGARTADVLTNDPLPAVSPVIPVAQRSEAGPIPRDRSLPVLKPLARARLVALLILVLVLALNGVLAMAYSRVFQDRLFPGVRIGGVDVGGLTKSQARALLRSGVAASADQPFLLQYGTHTWLVSAAEIGLDYRFAEAWEQAWDLGRRGFLFRAWWDRWRIGLWGEEVPLIVTLKRDSLDGVLDQVASELDRPLIPPAVVWQEGRWWIAPGQDGRHVIREDVERRLVAGITALVEVGGGVGGPAVIAIPVMTDTAALSDAEVARLGQQLARVGQPLMLRSDENEWIVDEVTIAEWVRVELGAVPGDASVDVDEQALRAYLIGLAPEVARPVQHPLLEVEGGRAVVFQIGRDGRRLDVNAATARVEDACRKRLDGGSIHVVELPTQAIAAGENPLMAELGVAELVGQGTSTFVGSPVDRSTNIFVGGEELHGRLIAPDEVFSLNAALDPITWEKGYRSSPIIVGNSLVMGLGGGLCQVATTLYRAALYSGLEIVERHPHLWRLDWYEQDSPPGFDATILLGGPDLKFRNNTGHTLLLYVETDLEAARQTIRLYGTSPGWEVTVDSVEITNWGHAVSYVRTVSKEGEVLSQETIYSYYQ